MEQTLRVGNRTLYEWVAALPAFIVLILVVTLNTSGALHAQLLRLGETMWAGYFQLRIDPVAPSCNRTMDIDTELARLVAQSKAADDLDLLAEEVDEGALRQSLLSAQAQCAERFAQYEDASKRLTFGVKVFRAIELSVAQFGEFGLVSQRIMLAVLVLICGLTALFRRHHIALRPMETEMDYRVAAIGQTIANGILFYSVYSFKSVVFSSGVAVTGQHAALHYLWILGFYFDIKYLPITFYS
jgi:hypothetical protein